MPEDLKFTHFSNFPNLRYFFSNIKDGNISFKYGKKNKVRENRLRLYKKLNLGKACFFEVEQSHSSNVVIINKKNRYKNKASSKADGLITNLKGFKLMIKTADCFPVILYDPQKNVLGLIHVGWRGGVNKILTQAIMKMVDNFNILPSILLVGIGPGINACCYKYKNFSQEKSPIWKKYIKQKNGLKSLSLKDYIKAELVSVGVKSKNIEALKVCTSCCKRLFSYYRSLRTGEEQGRFATIVALKN